jgi:hypothetical protein
VGRSANTCNCFTVRSNLWLHRGQVSLMTVDAASWLSCNRQMTRKQVPQLGQEVTEKNFMFRVSAVKANGTFPQCYQHHSAEKVALVG